MVLPPTPPLPPLPSSYSPHPYSPINESYHHHSNHHFDTTSPSPRTIDHQYLAYDSYADHAYATASPSPPPLPPNPYRSHPQQQQPSPQPQYQQYQHHSPSPSPRREDGTISEQRKGGRGSPRDETSSGSARRSFARSSSSSSSAGIIGLYDRSPNASTMSEDQVRGEGYFPQQQLSNQPPPSSSYSIPSPSRTPTHHHKVMVPIQHADGFYSPSTSSYLQHPQQQSSRPILNASKSVGSQPTTPPLPYPSRPSVEISRSQSERTQVSPPPPPTRITRPSVRQPSISSTTSSLAYSSSGRSVSTVTHQNGSYLSPNTSNATLGRMDSGKQSWTVETFPEFLNPALLSNVAVFMKDTVRRRTNMKGPVEHGSSFTGNDVVSTISYALPTIDRIYALSIARTLQQSLWFREIDYDERILRDTAERVYVFDDDTDDRFDTFTPAEEENNIPTGVLTTLTKCYSSFCGKLDQEGVQYACYAFSCPNKSMHRLRRQGSLLSTPEIVEEPEDWIASVPPSVVDMLPKSEIQRQSLMFELIQGEINYMGDLDLIQKGFVEPLRAAQPPIIPPTRLDRFLADILLNIADIRECAHTFLDALLTRQREQYPCITGIGDIILRSAVEWQSAYTEFTVNFPIATARFKEEKKRNPKFVEFLHTFSRLPEAKRQEFEHFQTRSTFRAVRYLLLLERILKKTDEEDVDRSNLEQAIAVISRQSKEANEGIALTKSRLYCSDYAQDLVKKPGDLFELELEEPTRRHFTSSRVYRRPEGSGFIEWSESHLILFDHYLVVTKPARLDRDGRSKYLISRRPIPLELIVLRSNSFSDPAVPRSSGFHLRSFGPGSSSDSAVTSPASQESGGLVYPISFRQLGRHESTVTYYVETSTIRLEWEKQLTEACALRTTRFTSQPVVRLEVISDTTFGATSFGSLTPSAPASAQFGRPTCSAPLLSSDGQELVAVGSPEGLFIGHRSRSRSMRQVLHLPEITQCAVLQELGWFLVVAGRILIAYPIEALVPSSSSSSTSSIVHPAAKAPQKLSGQKDVVFFRVGQVGDVTNPRTLVIYVKRSGVKESVFKALEPISLQERNTNASHRFLGFGGGGKSESFKTYKDFFIPSSSSSIQFLRSKLAIICSRGVEIMNMENLRTMSVPDFSAYRNDPTSILLAKRCEEATSLGMFRIQDNEFLLCYDDFAFLVDKHGEPITRRYNAIIDWESKPEAVAYHSGYVYAFSPTMIEIRHGATGRLAQVIIGSMINLTYDGTGIESPGADENSSEKRIQFCMKVGSYYVVYQIVPVGFNS